MIINIPAKQSRLASIRIDWNNCAPVREAGSFSLPRAGVSLGRFLCYNSLVPAISEKCGESMSLPPISVILPVRNEERYIRDCVASIFAQDYPVEKMEVLFVDGRSEDRTVELLQELQKEHPEIRVYDNPHRTVPYAMNIGIRESTAPVIVRLDAHAEYPPDYIRLSVTALLTQDCENAGGIFVTRGRGFMGEAIAEMLKTPLGVGNASYRLSEEPGYVDTVPFGCFHRELFERIGGFDERLTRNQDNELNYRIRKNGGKIWMDPRIRVLYYCRDSMRGIMRMGYMNGKWNVITMALVPGSMGMRHFVPLAFVLCTAVGLLGVLFHNPVLSVLLGLMWGAYLLLDGFYSFEIAKEKGMRFLPVEFILYPAFHFAYGFGSLTGIAALPAFLREERKKKEGGKSA